MKNLLVVITIFTFQFAQAQQHTLEKMWQTDSILKVPESVLYDAKNRILYVANIDGAPAEKDGKGSIGKVGLDGKIIAIDWVSGLNAPKGMGLYGNTLYVSDVDRVVGIDIKAGKIIQEIPIAGSKFLNDITIDKKGVIFVSDSRDGKVYRITNSKPEKWLEGLKGPNGLLWHDNQFFVLDAGALLKVDDSKNLIKITDGMEGGTDGIEHIQGSEYIISCWSGVIYHVDGQGNKQKLLDTRENKINSADIGYDATKRIVYVPTFYKNSVVAYKVN
jgi:ribosomal protein L24E